MMVLCYTISCRVEASDSIPLRYRSRFHSATLPLAISFHFISFHFIPFHSISNDYKYIRYFPMISHDCLCYSPEIINPLLCDHEYEIFSLFSTISEYLVLCFFDSSHHKCVESHNQRDILPNEETWSHYGQYYQFRTYCFDHHRDCIY